MALTIDEAKARVLLGRVITARLTVDRAAEGDVSAQRLRDEAGKRLALALTEYEKVRQDLADYLNKGEVDEK